MKKEIYLPHKTNLMHHWTNKKPLTLFIATTLSVLTARVHCL